MIHNTRLQGCMRLHVDSCLTVRAWNSIVLDITNQETAAVIPQFLIVSQTKINPLLCRGMKDLQIKERAPVLV